MVFCRVYECKEEHKYHYCLLCDDSNSDHMAWNCPYGVNLYHGTKAINLIPIVIEKEGLKPSTSGRLGPGIYFATRDIAWKIAKYRDKGKMGAVIKCRVNL